METWEEKLYLSAFIVPYIARKYNLCFSLNLQDTKKQKKSICFHADKNSSQDYQNWTREERQPKFLPENDIFDEVSFGVEHVTSHPRCPDERHGLRVSFIWSNLFGNYSALKFVYYTAYDKREFHLPLYFDLPANF